MSADWKCPEDRFPMMGPGYSRIGERAITVPLAFVQAHERQAQSNHGQSILAILAPRPDVPSVEDIARTICVALGQEPDDEAPLGMVCGPNNEPLPYWRYYEEQAQAVHDRWFPSGPRPDMGEAHEPIGCPIPGACACPSPMSPNKRASIICDFMGWSEEGPAWKDAHRLAAMLSAAPLPPQSGWRPIDTAPRDGKPVLLLMDGIAHTAAYQGPSDGSIYAGQPGLSRYNWFSLSGQHSVHDDQVEGWMPLPAAPSNPSEGG